MAACKHNNSALRQHVDLGPGCRAPLESTTAWSDAIFNTWGFLSSVLSPPDKNGQLVDQRHLNGFNRRNTHRPASVLCRMVASRQSVYASDVERRLTHSVRMPYRARCLGSRASDKTVIAGDAASPTMSRGDSGLQSALPLRKPVDVVACERWTQRSGRRRRWASRGNASLHHRKNTGDGRPMGDYSGYIVARGRGSRTAGCTRCRDDVARNKSRSCLVGASGRALSRQTQHPCWGVFASTPRNSVSLRATLSRVDVFCSLWPFVLRARGHTGWSSRVNISRRIGAAYTSGAVAPQRAGESAFFFPFEGAKR